MTNELGIFISNDRPVVSSRDIARVFEKEHKIVLRSIRDLDCSESFSRYNFVPSNYEDGRGKEYPEYLITRDGFSFLAMGFTGAKAAEFKEKYIAAFNAMEQELLHRPQLPDFTDPAIAARAWADEYEQRRALEADVKDLKNRLGEGEQWLCAKAMKWVHNYLDTENNTAWSQFGIFLKKLSEELAYPVETIADTKWNRVNKYRIEISIEAERRIKADKTILAKYRKER